MNKKSLIGIIVVIVVFVIAAVILGNLVYLYLLAAWIPEAILLAVWIYLVWMVRKKKNKILPDQMESKLAESRLKRLKVFLLVGGISLAVGIVGVILHGVLGILLEIEEEPVSFFIALVGGWAFFIATIGGLIIFLKGRRKGM